MSSKPPEVEEAIRILRTHLKYVVQSRDPEAVDDLWRTEQEYAPVTGQDNAYALSHKLQKKHPRMQYRVLKKNEAEAYTQGLMAGLRYAKKVSSHKPLRFLPENV